MNLTDNGRTVDEFMNDVSDIARNAGCKLRFFVDYMVCSVLRTKNTLAQEIRSKPVQSSIIALCTGLLLAGVLRRYTR